MESSVASSTDEDASSSTTDAEVQLLVPSATGGGRRVSRAKVWTTRVTIAAFFLVGGIEYSVIFPTLWDFLRGKGGEEWMYGLTLAAFSISNLVTGPLYGVIFDMTHQTKLIVLVANLFEIGGNFMYFSATSKYMIVGSRFIVGLGAGAGATLFGEVARVSTKRERTKVFSLYSTFRQLGLIFGPAFNLLLKLLNVEMGPFILNRLTAPGALMTVMWLVIEIMFLFLFFQLPSAVEPVLIQDGSEEPANGTTITQEMADEEEKEKELVVTGGRKPSKNKKKKRSLAKSAVGLGPNADESTPLLIDRQTTKRFSVNRADVPASGAVSRGGRLGKAGAYVRFVTSRMVREEIVVLLAVTFLTIFSQTVIETMLVPVAEALLDWNETIISIFFSAAGAEIIVGIVVVYIMSVWIGDRWIMSIGLLLGIVGYAWLIGSIGSGDKETSGAIWKFILGSILVLFSLPMILVAGASLYSKLLPMQVQGVGQGFRRSVFSVAAILGPLWSGSALAFPNYYTLLAVPLGLLIFVLILVLLSFVRLREPKTRGKRILLP